MDTNHPTDSIATRRAAVDASVKARYGFVDARDLAIMAAHPTRRLTLILVRMGACRFIAPAQDCKAIIDALEAAGDYCRDASLYQSA